METAHVVLNRMDVEAIQGDEGAAEEGQACVDEMVTQYTEETTGEFGELIVVNPEDLAETEQGVIDQEETVQNEDEEQVGDEDVEYTTGADSMEVQDLKKRVDQLENEVQTLQNELRLMKRKMRSYDPYGEDYQDQLEKNILKVLDAQNWRISRFMLKESGGRRPPGRPGKAPKLTHPARRGQKRNTEYLDSDDGDRDGTAGGIAMVDDEFADPDYQYGEEFNSENVKPKVVPKGRTRNRGPRKRGGGAVVGARTTVETPRERRVILVKKVEPQSPPPHEHDYDDGIEFTEYGFESPSEKSKDNVIRAGDVSVILEDDEEEQKYNSKKSRTRNKGRTDREPHARPKIMKCSHCDKMFRDQHDVTRHERTHTGEKPYFCDVCGPNMRFTQTYHLARHKVKYHLPGETGTVQ